MIQARMLEGTTKEIARQLQQEYAELLHERMQGELQPVADQEWAELRAGARTCLEQRKK